MHDLETLAYAQVPGAGRDTLAMQALAREVVEAGSHRLTPLARMLRRDLDAALAGKAQPWSEARTRFEARKLARLAPAQAMTDARESDFASAGADEADPASAAEARKRQIILRIAIAAVAAALWTMWIVSLQRSGPVAWDGGSGSEQTQNLFTLYAPAVLALLATLIAIDPPSEEGPHQ